MTEENGSRSDTAPSFGRSKGQGDSGGMGHEMATLPSDEPRRVAAGEVKVVKICKACMVSQAGGGGFCVKCGAELVPIRSVRDSCIGEVVGGKYKIVEQIGSGGMGEVYLGVNEPLGQRVAVKFLSRKFAADEGIILRFLNEARSYAKVSHPNAVTLLEYGQHDDGALYLITEFIEGKILTEVVKELGPMSVEQIVGIATQCCNVLSVAHKQGVIHRDLKPDNIMLIAETRGRYAVKVLDFGIAKILDDDHHNSSQMTETGSIFGTPEFMSPEQARGESTDGRSDLYALGVILFFIATARLPFRGKNKFAILNQQLNDAPPRPSEVRDNLEISPVLEGIILRCLNKKAEDRYQTADEVAVALEGLLTDAHGLSASNAVKLSEKEVHTKIRAVVDELSAVSDAELDDRMSVTLGNVEQGGDEGWSDSFVGSAGTEDGWDGELSEALDASDSGEGFLGEGGWQGDEGYQARSSGKGSLGPKAALLALMAALLVGGIWYASERLGGADVSGESGDLHQIDGSSSAESGLDMESLGGIARMIEAGDLEGASRSIQSMQPLLVTPEDRARLDELISRRQSAENLQKRVRAAIQGGQCDEAGRLAGMLAKVSKGAREELDGGLASCRRSAGAGNAVVRIPDRQEEKPAVVAPPVAEPAVVVPSSVVPVVAEPPKPVQVVEQQPVEEPGNVQPMAEPPNIEKNIEEPSSDTKEASPAESQKERPDESEDLQEDAVEEIDEIEERKKPSGVEGSSEMPDGMALPPRQL